MDEDPKERFKRRLAARKAGRPAWRRWGSAADNQTNDRSGGNRRWRRWLAGIAMAGQALALILVAWEAWRVVQTGIMQTDPAWLTLLVVVFGICRLVQALLGWFGTSR